MDKTYRNHSDYLLDAFGDINRMADRMLETVKDVEFDTMVGTGLSGTLVVPTLARAFGTYWAIVRKEHSPHTSNLIEGEIGHKWLFVDDFISSGETLRRVQSVMEGLQTYQVNGKDTWGYETWGYVPYPTLYVGTYEYRRDRMYPH